MSRTPQEMIDLTGRVVLVTGASGGIGSGVVNRLGQAGATPVTHGRSGDVDVKLDLSSKGAADELINATLDRAGQIDGLVNCAGIQSLKDFTRVNEADWDEMIDTNLSSIHRLTSAAASKMTEGSSIVHISSIEARHPTLWHGHYSVAKAGVCAHARAAALAYGPSGIRVNSISPGLIDRPGLEKDWPDGVNRWTSSAPLGRLGTPDDIGDATVFLISDLSRWITGIDLVVDGGVLTKSTW